MEGHDDEGARDFGSAEGMAYQDPAPASPLEGQDAPVPPKQEAGRSENPSVPFLSRPSTAVGLGAAAIAAVSGAAVMNHHRAAERESHKPVPIIASENPGASGKKEDRYTVTLPYQKPDFKIIKGKEASKGNVMTTETVDKNGTHVTETRSYSPDFGEARRKAREVEHKVSEGGKELAKKAEKETGKLLKKGEEEIPKIKEKLASAVGLVSAEADLLKAEAQLAEIKIRQKLAPAIDQAKEKTEKMIEEGKEGAKGLFKRSSEWLDKLRNK